MHWSGICNEVFCNLFYVLEKYEFMSKMTALEYEGLRYGCK